MSFDEPEREDFDQPLSADDLELALPSRGRGLPWSDRTIFVVSLVVVLVLSPIWIGPNTFLQIIGIQNAPTPAPTPAASPTARPSSVYDADFVGITFSFAKWGNQRPQ